MTEGPEPSLPETALASTEDVSPRPPAGGVRRRRRGCRAVAPYLRRWSRCWLISLIVFASTHVLGINVARRVLGRQATPQQLADFNRAHGLDRPLIMQYEQWLVGFVQGRLGHVGGQRTSP